MVMATMSQCKWNRNKKWSSHTQSPNNFISISVALVNFDSGFCCLQALAIEISSCQTFESFSSVWHIIIQVFTSFTVCRSAQRWNWAVWMAQTRCVFCLVSANEIAFIEKSNFLFIRANSWLWHKPQIGWFTYSSLVNFFLPLFAATSRATVDKQSATAIKRFVSCPVGRYFPFLQSHDNARVNVWPNQKF